MDWGHDLGGSARIEATLPGSEDVIGSTATLVEAFVPARIELHAAAAAERFGPGQEPIAELSGKYLFGPPAAGLPWSLNVAYLPQAFKSKAYPDFRFGDAVARPTYNPPEVEGETDEHGLAKLVLPPPRDASAGRWRADCSITLTEPGGRSLSRNFSTLVDMTARFVGLRLASGEIAPNRKRFAVEFVQCDGSDAATDSASIDITLVNVEHENLLQRVNGQTVWKSTERLIPIATRTIDGNSTAKAPGSFEIECPSAGSYRLTAVDSISKSVTTLAFYATDDAGDSAPVALNRPEHVHIVLDFAARQARCPRQCPYSLTLRRHRPLVTLETDKVVHTRVVELSAGSERIEFDVPESLRGGAFLGVGRPRGRSRTGGLAAASRDGNCATRHRALGQAHDGQPEGPAFVFAGEATIDILVERPV